MFHFKSVFSLRVYQSFVSYCFVSSSYPPTLGDFINFNVIGWQTVLLGISLTVNYFLFVSLINLSSFQKANCVFFVLGIVVGEL